MEFTESEFLFETEVPYNEVIVSHTDLKGIITYVNDIFAEISGYEEGELLGKPHSIVRHPDMPKSVFKDLWETIESGKDWEGVVKNMRKDKGYYWVYAYISRIYKDGELIGYKSIREPISDELKREYQIKYDNLKRENKEAIRVVKYIKE